jgi:hypothetical protein
MPLGSVSIFRGCEYGCEQHCAADAGKSTTRYANVKLCGQAGGIFIAVKVLSGQCEGGGAHDEDAE